MRLGRIWLFGDCEMNGDFRGYILLRDVGVLTN